MAIASYKSALVIATDPDIVRMVDWSLSIYSLDVTIVETVDRAKRALARASRNILVVLDAAFDGAGELLPIVTGFGCHVIVGDGATPRLIRLLEGSPAIDNVISRNSPCFEEELCRVVKWGAPSKALPQSPKPSDFLADPAETWAVMINDYGKKHVYLDQVMQFAARAKAFPHFENQMALLAWELMMNAIFDALEAEDGFCTPLLRTENVMLGKNHAVRLMCGYDGTRMMISLKDNFGTLEKNPVIRSLARATAVGPVTAQGGVEGMSGGAGVGLLLVLNACSALYFFVSPGRSTEVIGLIYPVRERRVFKIRQKSFYFFTSKVA